MGLFGLSVSDLPDAPTRKEVLTLITNPALFVELCNNPGNKADTYISYFEPADVDALVRKAYAEKDPILLKINAGPRLMQILNKMQFEDPSDELVFSNKGWFKLFSDDARDVLDGLLRSTPDAQCAQLVIEKSHPITLWQALLRLDKQNQSLFSYLVKMHGDSSALAPVFTTCAQKLAAIEDGTDQKRAIVASMRKELISPALAEAAPGLMDEIHGLQSTSTASAVGCDERAHNNPPCNSISDLIATGFVTVNGARYLVNNPKDFVTLIKESHLLATMYAKFLGPKQMNALVRNAHAQGFQLLSQIANIVANYQTLSDSAARNVSGRDILVLRRVDATPIDKTLSDYIFGVKGEEVLSSKTGQWKYDESRVLSVPIDVAADRMQDADDILRHFLANLEIDPCAELTLKLNFLGAASSLLSGRLNIVALLSQDFAVGNLAAFIQQSDARQVLVELFKRPSAKEPLLFDKLVGFFKVSFLRKHVTAALNAMAQKLGELDDAQKRTYVAAMKTEALHAILAVSSTTAQAFVDAAPVLMEEMHESFASRTRTANAVAPEKEDEPEKENEPVAAATTMPNIKSKVADLAGRVWSTAWGLFGRASAWPAVQEEELDDQAPGAPSAPPPSYPVLPEMPDNLVAMELIQGSLHRAAQTQVSPAPSAPPAYSDNEDSDSDDNNDASDPQPPEAVGERATPGWDAAMASLPDVPGTAPGGQAGATRPRGQRQAVRG